MVPKLASLVITLVGAQSAFCLLASHYGYFSSFLHPAPRGNWYSAIRPGNIGTCLPSLQDSNRISSHHIAQLK